jgi:DNA-binding MarR family transcriptional regulator
MSSEPGPRSGGATAPELVAAARAIAFAARTLERALGGMTLPQFRVLALIAASSERASRVAERAAVSRPSLTGLLDGLEARGWVTRTDVAGDRRGVLLAVTPAGAHALAEAEGAMAAGVGDLLGVAPPGQRAALVRGLGLLGDALRTAHERRRAASEPPAARARVRRGAPAPASLPPGRRRSPRRPAPAAGSSASGLSSPLTGAASPWPSACPWRGRRSRRSRRWSRRSSSTT